MISACGGLLREEEMKEKKSEDQIELRVEYRTGLCC